TISADGEYSYARNESTPGDVSDVFTYTLTDGDDDTDTATLTITIADAGVGFEDLEDDQESDGVLRGSDIFVNESKLAGGTGVGDGAAEQTGTFTVSSPDGIANLSITQGGNTVTLVTDNVVHDFTGEGPLVITTALGNTLSITSFDASTGEVGYTYTLLSGETHEDGDGRNDLFESFTVTLEDMDGDDTTGTLGVRIVDDVPVITEGAGDPALSVDEASLAAPASLAFAGLFDINHGADGEGAVPLQYSLSVGSAGVDSGLVDTETGTVILLYVEGNDVVGRVGGPAGDIAVVVSVDAASGTVTLEQKRAVQHDDPDDHNDSISISDGAIFLSVVATDGDGDSTDPFSVDIGSRLSFIDDGLDAVDDANEVPQGSYLAVTGNVIAGDGTSGEDTVGADGARVTQVTFTHPDDGLQTVVVPDTNADVTIPGQYGVLTISADGEYSYQRNPDTAGGVEDEFTYTLTDGDDDTDTATLTITIADAGVGLEGLEDDQEGDGVLQGSDIFVNESKLAGGTGVGDGAAEQTGIFTVSSLDGIANLSITQGGNTVTLVTDNVVHDFTEEGPLVITTALGNTLSITSFDPETGEVSYTYTLLSGETHEDGDGRNDLFESFTVTLEDMDGDDTTGTLGVRIVDDVPVITEGAGDPALSVDEASLAAPASLAFAGLFDINHGADGEGAVPLQYSLSVGSAGVDSGLVDTETGTAI
ncbi:hypothetical protein H0A73_22670, partial [Alcaligenaceae bacterium]|nr:hypothetical protein [Alcaligenaceae bacterium]